MAFQKGHPQLGHIQKGQKWSSSIKKEEMEKYFNERVTKNLELLVDAQLEDSLANWKARHYTFDRVLGKPRESLEISGDEDKPIVIQISSAIKRIYADPRTDSS